MSSSAQVRDSNEPDKAVPFATQAEIVVSDPILYEAGIEPLSRTGQRLLYPDGRSPAGRTMSWRGLRGETVDPAKLPRAALLRASACAPESRCLPKRVREEPSAGGFCSEETILKVWR